MGIAIMMVMVMGMITLEGRAQLHHGQGHHDGSVDDRGGK